MTTEKTEKGGKLGMLKPFMQPAAKLGAATAGFVLAHVGYTKTPANFKTGLQGFAIALTLAIATIWGSTKVKNEHVKNGMLGLGLYSSVKAVNALTGIVPTKMEGLGAFELPKGAKDVINMLFPTLGAAEPIHVDFSGMQIYDQNADLGNAVDQTYEFMDGTDGIGNFASDVFKSITANGKLVKLPPVAPPKANPNGGNQPIVFQNGQKFMITTIQGLGEMYVPMEDDAVNLAGYENLNVRVA